MLDNLTRQAGPGDSAIEQAWLARVEALDTYDLVTAENGERAFLRDLEAAEEAIQATAAQTLEGVATQLWTLLGRKSDTNQQDDVTRCRDLSRLLQIEQTFDWDERLVIAALRSLASLTGAS